MTIRVVPLSDVPVANDDAASTLEDTTVSIPVLANDSDSDGDPLSIVFAFPGLHGSTSINGAVISYSPLLGYNGSDMFSYTVRDPSGNTATAWVTIIVTAVNDAPVAINDSATTNEDTSVGIQLVANDVDFDGDALTVQSVGPELQIAARELAFAVAVLEHFERADVPQHHAARAVVALGNVAFEVAIADRVILDMHRQLLRQWDLGWALWNGPALQRAADLKPQIVMQAGRVVALDEQTPLRVLGRFDGCRGRFGRVLELAFANVLLERHRIQKDTCTAGGAS